MTTSFHQTRYFTVQIVVLITLLITAFATKGLAQSPQRIEATRMVQMGENRMQQAKFEEAIFSYSNAIATDPYYAEAYMKRASIYRKLGRYREAKQDYEKARMMNPYSAYVMDANAKINFLTTDYK